MKVSRAKAAANRERIVDVAGALFRKKGFNGIGVADIMQAAELTHGGFYGHFGSKDDLAAEASRKAMAKSVETWERLVAEMPDKPLAVLLRHYLSPRHRDEPGRGCAFSALGPDAARQTAAVRSAFTDGLRPLVDVLARFVPGGSKAARRRKALATMSQMVGAVVLARAVNDAALSDEILAAAKADLLAD